MAMSLCEKTPHGHVICTRLTSPFSQICVFVVYRETITTSLSKTCHDTEENVRLSEILHVFAMFHHLKKVDRVV